MNYVDIRAIEIKKRNQVCIGDKNELPLILTRNGQPIAALFSIDDLDLETLSVSINPKFINILEQSRNSQKEAGRIFLDDIHIP
ncbi:MAG: hypothetical protein HC849_23035 [Oscillatoriales cyanobacterium RU_3_3]|nr:hypothetical protein [Microcoleus sp. SM1_3_4]NJM62416.1 hypothetical protein [Oscillatoriales cyanobacterium RU_3_3]NJR25096.1 hypothetical protein [Richelia sp. CSU_2_1]